MNEFSKINTLDPGLFKYKNTYSGTSPKKKTIMHLGNSPFSTNDIPDNLNICTIYLWKSKRKQTANFIPLSLILGLSRESLSFWEFLYARRRRDVLCERASRRVGMRAASSSLSGAYLQNYTSYGYEMLWVDRSHQGGI